MNNLENTYFYTYMIYCNEPSSSLYGCIYYGKHSTNNLADGYITSGAIISKYIKKHPNGYYRKILQFYDSEEKLNKAEYDLIYPHLGKKYCLNLKDGGLGGRLHEETKKKIKITLQGNTNGSGKRGEEQCKHISDGWYKSDTESRVKKQRNSLKKYYEDPIHRQQASEAIKLKWQDPEYREKVCAAHTRVITEEELEKRSKSLKGKNKGKHKVWDDKEKNIYHMEY